MSQIADSSRSLIALSGEDVETFLQGILTQDIKKLNESKIQFAALLSPQGRILHDMFVVAGDNVVYLDTPTAMKELLIKRLTMYRLRAKVAIRDVSAEFGVSYPAAGLPDPRHPDLPHRLYGPTTEFAELSAQAHETTLALGIPDSAKDFEADSVVAMDAGYDLLNAISFTKGCYVGQEVTARMHYKNIARRGFYRLESDIAPPRLALLKFEEVEAAGGIVTVDNTTYHAHLPAWMAPKFYQFKTASEKQ